MLTATFTEEDDASEPTDSTPEPEAAYTFEGFEVEFSERIMLTPLGTGRGATERG